MSFAKEWPRATAAAFACVLVAGCGDVLSSLDSGGGTSGKTTLTNVNPDGTTGPARGSVSGVAMNGRLMGGNVRIFSFSGGNKGNMLAAGQMDAQGRYEVDLKVISQPLLIEISGGRYVEPASGETVDLGEDEALLAVQNYRSGNALSVSVTHFTTLATGLAENMVRMGFTPPRAVEAANQRIPAIAGLAAGFDALTAKSVNISDAASVTPFVTSELEYGFVDAALSTLTEAVSITANRPVHESINSITLTQLALDDVRRDGVLDGQGTQGALAIGLTPLSTDIYRNTLALNVLRMAADTQGNKTSISPVQVLPLAQRLNNSTDPIYGGRPVIPLNVDAPVIADLSIAPNALLAGTTILTASVMSLVGVTAVELLIDDVVVGTASDPIKPSISFDTSRIADGGHQLSVRATDLIGGKTTTAAFAVMISNAQGNIGNISLINGSVVRGTVNVTADIIDSAGIAQVGYFVDNFQPVVTTDPKTPFKLDTVALALDDARPHTLRITANNNLGREITSPTINFNVDNQAPAVTISSPAAGAFLRQQFTLAAAATDNGPLGRLELSIDAEQRPDITRVPEGFLINTLNFTEGNHVLAARSVDQAGNDAVATLSVTFDNTPPSVTITSPAQNAAIRGAFDVVAALGDNFALDTMATKLLERDLRSGVERAVALTGLIGDTLTQRIEGASIPQDGTHSYSVIARDRAGNTFMSAPVSVIIDNTAPVISVDSVQFDNDACFVSGSISDASNISEATIVRLGRDALPAISLATPSFSVRLDRTFFLRPTFRREDVVDTLLPAVRISSTDTLGNTSSFDFRIGNSRSNGDLTSCQLLPLQLDEGG